MSEIILLYQKEYKNFFKRKHMIKWLIIVTFMGLLYPFITEELYSFIGLSKHMFCLLAIGFVASFIPATMALDAVGAEKNSKTMETLISTPLEIKNVFIGKLLFGLTIVTSSFLVMFTYTNVILYLTTGESLITYLETETILYVCISVTLIQNIVFLVTNAGGLASSNYKLVGYFGSFIAIILIIILKLTIDYGNEFYLYYIGLLVLSTIVMFIIIKSKVTKSRIVKYVR